MEIALIVIPLVLFARFAKSMVVAHLRLDRAAYEAAGKPDETDFLFGEINLSLFFIANQRYKSLKLSNHLRSWCNIYFVAFWAMILVPLLYIVWSWANV